MKHLGTCFQVIENQYEALHIRFFLDKEMCSPLQKVEKHYGQIHFVYYKKFSQVFIRFSLYIVVSFSEIYANETSIDNTI